MVKVKAIYPFQVGDIVDLWGERFIREEDGAHYANVSEETAAALVEAGNAEIV